MPACHKFFKIHFITSMLGMLICIGSIAQEGSSTATSGKRLNIIIASRLRSFDVASLSFQAQAGIQKLFHRRKLYLVYVDSIEEAASRIEKLIEKKKARIKNLWFDSHGHFGRRVSIFEVGGDEVNYRTIQQEHIYRSLQRIGRYCDTSTIVAIGSCYSAATFTNAALDSFPQQRMNGDSLMMSLSKLMGNATVYGSESWVMTKPFIFGSSYALAGGPSAKKFHDPLLLPAWETLGKWSSYSGATNTWSEISTVAMDTKGNIILKKQPFLDYPSRVKRQQRVISNLHAGNYSHQWFAKYRYAKHESADQ